MSCPGGCGADEAKGWCCCWDDGGNVMTTDGEAIADGHHVAGRMRVRRDRNRERQRPLQEAA